MLRPATNGDPLRRMVSGFPFGTGDARIPSAACNGKSQNRARASHPRPLVIEPSNAPRSAIDFAECCMASPKLPPGPDCFAILFLSISQNRPTGDGRHDSNTAAGDTDRPRR
jgi:hypothetical protein